jgi:hypothetical protein
MLYCQGLAKIRVVALQAMFNDKKFRLSKGDRSILIQIIYISALAMSSGKSAGADGQKE